MKKTALVGALVMTGALGWASVASAANPVIGFDQAGSSHYIYADIWSDRHDTGIDTVLVDAGFGGLAPGSVHQFNTQVQVDSFTLNGSNVPVTGLNSTFELTKEIEFEDVVTDFLFGAGGPTSFPNSLVFGHRPDAYNNLTIYVDNLADGTVNNPNAPGAECYGSGTSVAVKHGTTNPDPCSTDAGGGDGDGVAILTGNLISNVSSFTATSATTGIGSFDLLFAITSFDPDYIDVSNLAVDGGTGLPLLGIAQNGNLIAPETTFTPAKTWNGITPTGNLAFGVNASESFTATVPAPTSVLLLGAGLVGMRFFRRKRSA